MALDLDSFRELYSEMVKVPDATVQAKLDEAEGRLSVDFWGDNFDAAHGLMAAHLIAISPAGRQARLAPDKSTSTSYMREYTSMVEENYPGPVIL